MTPYLTGKGKTYLGRVHDEEGRAYVRSLGTTNAVEARRVQDFLTGLRRNRRWRVIEHIIARRVTAFKAFDWSEFGILATRIDNLEAGLVVARDVDLDPLVAEWNGKGRRSQSDRYVAQVREMIPAGQRFPRSRFTKGAIAAFLAGLDFASPTKNRYRAALLQFGRWLVQRDILSANPVREVDGYPENDPRMVFYTREQAKALLNVLPAPYKALEALMAGTGMERQAVLRARRRDVNLDERTVFADGGKNRWRRRTVVVTEDWLWPIIEAHVRTITPNALLFDVSDRQAITAHHEATEAAKLHRSVLHDWRHSYAIWNLRDGIEPAFIRPQLGHAPGSTVLESVYQAWIPSPAERRERAKRAADSASKPARRRSRRGSP